MTTTLIESREDLVLSPLRCSDGNGTLSYLFFSEEYVDVQRAKAICAKCSTRAQCLSTALERAEPWGFGAVSSSKTDGFVRQSVHVADQSLALSQLQQSRRCRSHFISGNLLAGRQGRSSR